MQTLSQISPSPEEFGSLAMSPPVSFNVEKVRAPRRKRTELRKMKVSSSACQIEGDGLTRKAHALNCEALLTPSRSTSPGSSSDDFDDLADAAVSCVSHGSISILGKRREMEDAVTVEIGFAGVESEKYDFFGVYDGHGGARVAEACKDRMHRILEREIDEALRNRKKKTPKAERGGVVDWDRAMTRCFEKMDTEVGGDEEEVEEMTVGSTAVVAVVGKEELVIANCGDSRAVVCRGGVAVPLSIDHKPDKPDELARIEGAGGRVINWNGPRVLGVLAMSRSIGDHYLRPYVISKPEVSVCRRSKDDEFLILASDGLWDVISNEIACLVVRRCLNGKIRRVGCPCPCPDDGTVGQSYASHAAALLAEFAIARGSRDNISVVVVELRKPRK